MARPKAKFDIVAEDKTAKAFKSVGGRMDAMGRAAKATGALVATAVAGLGVLVGKTLNAADAQAKLAQSTGFTVQELGRLAHAAELSGTSFDRVAKSGLNRFSRSIFDANAGLKESTEVFDAMDINIKNLDGTLKSSGDLLNQVADKFATYENGVAKSALAQKLFGRSGTEMIPLLNAGSVGMAAMGDEAERLGVVFNDKTAKASERFNDNLTRLKAAYTGQVNSITQHLLPGLEALSNRFVATAKDGVKLARTGEAVAAGFKVAVDAIDIIVSGFGVLGRAAGAVAAIIINQFKAVGGVVAATASAVVKVLKGDFAGAYKAIEKGSSDLAGGFKRDTALLKAAATDIKKVADRTIGRLADTWTSAGDEIEAATPELAGKIAAPLVEAEDKIATASKKLPEVVKDVAVDPMVETAKNGIERLGDVFAQGWRDVLDGNANFGDTMKSWFKGLMAELLHTATTNRIVIGISGALGLGGSGTASAATPGSFIGGGGGGSGGFSLSSITNLVGDPVGGLMNAASFAQQFALDRGFTGAANFFKDSAANLANSSNLVNGASGFIGNFGANALFGDDRGAGANIGGTIGAIAGSFIPVPVVGPMIGSFIGNAIGGLFGSSPSPPKFHVRGSNTAFSAGTDNDGNARTVEGFGALGGLQFSAQHIADDNSFLQNQPFIDAVIALDNQVAGMLSDRAVGLAKSAAQSYEYHSKGSVDIGTVLRNRAATIGAGIGEAGGRDQWIAHVLTLDTTFEQLTADLQLLELTGAGAASGMSVVADQLSQGLSAINDKFAAMTARATELGLPLDRLNDLRDAERLGLEQTLGLSGIRSLYDSLTRNGFVTNDNPDQDFFSARNNFERLAGAARLGDVGALQSVSGAAQAYISEAEANFASGQRTQDIKEQVLSLLKDLLSTGAGNLYQPIGNEDQVLELQAEVAGLRADLAAATVPSSVAQLQVQNAQQAAGGN